MSMNENYMVESRWTWRDRLRWRLFPLQRCDLPEAPATHEDCLVCRTYVYLDVFDRLRVLLTGWIMVETRTVTEHKIGAHVTNSVAYPILPPPPMEQPRDEHGR